MVGATLTVDLGAYVFVQWGDGYTEIEASGVMPENLQGLIALSVTAENQSRIHDSFEPLSRTCWNCDGEMRRLSGCWWCPGCRTRVSA